MSYFFWNQDLKETWYQYYSTFLNYYMTIFLKFVNETIGAPFGQWLGFERHFFIIISKTIMIIK